MSGLVALLAEGVDRNTVNAVEEMIENVALLAEGVDRNKDGKKSLLEVDGRPPRGGRG